MAKRKPGRPTVDLAEKVRALLDHTEGPSPSAESPIAHYREAVNASFALIAYIERHLSHEASYEAVRSRHMGLLNRFVLANLIETFERFIKDLAAICVDQLAPFVTDDRYDIFSARGNELIAHFEAGSIGKALCESDTWLNNRAINERFRKLLASLNGDLWKEFLFPSGGQPPKEHVSRAETLAVLWQLRHTLAHNSGVLTGSDAMKLRTLAGRPVPKDRILAPNEEDLRFIKRFLTESAEETNRRVAERLSALLTDVHHANNSPFDPQERADWLARLFLLPVTIDDRDATPPKPM